ELQITPLADAPEVYQPHVTVRPSTLVEHPIVWDGVSAALPGETLSRHRGQSTSRSETHSRMEEQEPAPELHASSSAVTSETAPIDNAFPPAHEELANAVEEEPAPLVLEEEDLNHSDLQEEAEFEPDASASHRVDPSSPSEFRLSSLFGRESEASEKRESEAAPVQAAAMESARAESAQSGEPQAESFHQADLEGEAAEQSAALEQPVYEGNSMNGAESAEGRREQSHEAAALDHLHAFTPGDGQVEEEEIDEEEYDFAPLPEHAAAQDDEHDLGDLVEEETQASGGAEFGDVIREAQIDRQVISSDDDDFEDSDEEEGVEDEEPATAVASEEGTPAPRRGRVDRQRGRERERRGRGRNGRRQSSQMSDLPIISELLKQGQEILVQIAKEPIAKKGARITSHIALPGRFLVFMPTVNHVGVSRKIWSDEERQRLKRILISEKGDASGGFIVRTAAENASEEELRADLRFLISLWNEIKQRSDAAKAPALIYHDLNLVERVLRDQVSDNFSTIWVDSEAEYERIVRFLNRFQPSLVRRVKLYTKETPLFEQFGIQDEITKALKSKVWLKSGGSIVINQTEALVAIDINTGKYVGKTARLEDTILKTNLDAIPEIVRQIRLRDLGGIIVIDFIDMDERKNRHKVMAALEEELKSDRAPSKVLQFNDFGLVAITRKRVKQSLERTLSVQCNICSGTGMVKGPTTVANEIYIEMRKMQKHFERHDVMLRVHPEVVKTLKGNNARWLNDLEEMTGRTIIVKSDPALHPEQFDIH
ncbi:MAG: Rne/Rng family ribonuclease, partial [Acidobacteriaceae bacterium]